jgi:hypothetical protein
MISVMTVVILGSSGDDTVFSKIQIVHRLINNFLNLFPVAPSLYKLVYVLCRWKVSIEQTTTM